MINVVRGSPRIRLVLAILVTGLAIGVASCGDGDETAKAIGTTSTAPAPGSDPPAATTSSTTTTTESTTSFVDVYFSTGDGSDCSEVQPFPRSVGNDADPMVVALEGLVGGPSPVEIEAGAGSFFTAETSDAIRSIERSDALLVIDFIDLRPLLSNASSSCGSEALLAQLDHTAFQFAGVERVRYLMEGSCDAFANWLQRDCFETDRSGRSLAVPTNERASGSGCAPSTPDRLPPGRWFGFITDTNTDGISFDLACWFSAAAAIVAAEEDGAESPPPNDYHIRNANPALRELAVDPSIDVAWLPEFGDPNNPEILTYDEWRIAEAARTHRPGVWLTVDADGIVRIDEQYVP